MTAAAARRPLVPIGDIVGGLADGIEALCRQLLPGGRRERDEWVTGGGASPFGCSVSVHLRSPRKGIWKAWASGDAGDALDLVAAIAGGGDKSAAVKWARDWLGYEAGQPPPQPSPACGGGSEARAKAEQDAADEDEQRRRGAAFRLWLAAEPSLKGTPVERYLLGRGIDLARLGRQPAALRCHPGLWHERAQRKFPAMVALISRWSPAGSAPVAVHRTWLTEDGRKAPVFDAAGKSEAKLSYGAVKGGVIPLWRGACGKPLAAAPEGSVVWLSEGIEDGLSIALLTGGVDRVLCAVSLGNMAHIGLPPAIATVVIAGQNDAWWHEPTERPHPTQRGLDATIRHFQGEGRQVLLWRPDQPGCKDANDVARLRMQQEDAA